MDFTKFVLLPYGKYKKLELIKQPNKEHNIIEKEIPKIDHTSLVKNEQLMMNNDSTDSENCHTSSYKSLNNDDKIEKKEELPNDEQTLNDPHISYSMPPGIQDVHMEDSEKNSDIQSSSSHKSQIDTNNDDITHEEKVKKHDEFGLFMKKHHNLKKEKKKKTARKQMVQLSHVKKKTNHGNVNGDNDSNKQKWIYF